MRTKTRAAFLIAGALAVVVLGCGGVASKVVGPSASREGESWTHKELAEHLKSKGLQFEERPTHHGGFYGTPMEFDFGDGTVLVVLMDTAQKARDNAGANPGAHAWGRFYFSGSKKRVEEIRGVLQ